MQKQPEITGKRCDHQVSKKFTILSQMSPWKTKKRTMITNITSHCPSGKFANCLGCIET